jgi:hypothetical protein
MFILEGISKTAMNAFELIVNRDLYPNIKILKNTEVLFRERLY